MLQEIHHDNNKPVRGYYKHLIIWSDGGSECYAKHLAKKVRKYLATYIKTVHNFCFVSHPKETKNETLVKLYQYILYSLMGFKLGRYWKKFRNLTNISFISRVFSGIWTIKCQQLQFSRCRRWWRGSLTESHAPIRLKNKTFYNSSSALVVSTYLPTYL